MAGLFLLREDDPFLTRAKLLTARAIFARQGLAQASEFAVPGWRGFHTPYAVGGPEMMLAHGGDLAVVAGTLAVDGQTGTPALRALLAMMDRGTPDWTRIAGHFVALVSRRGRVFLFCDYFAAYQLHHDREHRHFSTSLVAAAETCSTVRFDPQGVYEFAFNVTPLGDDTVFEELKLLGPGVMLELTPDGVVQHALAKPLPERVEPMPLNERIARHRAALETVLRAHVGERARVHCPLSGGLDSRLLLACLRRLDAAADVYVYGPPGSDDVEVARTIGDALGFPVHWIDKQRSPIEPDAFPEVVERNFHAFDALPTFGNIFDNGGHLRARDARHAGGWPAASGGCGEVYRNFFYLPDRPTPAMTVARSFFARFATSDATALFDPDQFIRRIRDKILDSLGRPDDLDPLPRPLIEQIYPRLRCRALFGRELSLESRQSPYLMPFLERAVVGETSLLPQPLRAAGAFEASLLEAIDPDLAAQPSAYGHSFAGRPSRRHRLAEWSSRVRPVWLRQRSYAIQRRLRPMSDEHGGLLSPDWLGRVVDLNFPAMRRFFRVERITDEGLYRRVACLEHLAQQLGSRLVS